MKKAFRRLKSVWMGAGVSTLLHNSPFNLAEEVPRIWVCFLACSSDVLAIGLKSYLPVLI